MSDYAYGQHAGFRSSDPALAGRDGKFMVRSTAEVYALGEHVREHLASQARNR